MQTKMKNWIRLIVLGTMSLGTLNAQAQQDFRRPPGGSGRYPSQGSQQGYPAPRPGYPGSQPGYPSQPNYPAQPGYPGSQPGYPGSQPGYPGSQPGYPGSQPGYPGPQPGYPSPQPAPCEPVTDIYRFFNGFDHFLTINPNEGGPAGYGYEGIAFRLFTNNGRGRMAIFRCVIPGREHFNSNNYNCEGWPREGLLGFADAQANPSASRQIFRCFNGNAHLTTSNPGECRAAGFRIEGGLGFVP